jgi:hypothetical protein
MPFEPAPQVACSKASPAARMLSIVISSTNT